ncbi:hypothetical protein LTR47_003691 [Exophiala xenobiotica]|nr:hypothetical protein LTR41_010116 [Exophiala xenobiotica]KAK5235506.1 hypothetical protein LTR47_003691 [Exophiala xenobiotica]KAK5369657.1 hypothetical protein LTR11_006989 [Exophiala xenobiotica]KAK5371690.1 hypothetical protein LTS03_006788 [Exophiala xenobiotica]
MGDTESKKREFFDQIAVSHQTEFAPLVDAAIQEFQDRRLWIRDDWTDVRLLDYACGAGAASKALMPFVSQAVGLDFSEGMVAEYNKWAAGTGFGPERAHAYQSDLLNDDEVQVVTRQKPELVSNFDVVVLGSALHHVGEPAKLLERLAKCLRPGGVCVVLDKAPDNDEDIESTSGATEKPRAFTEVDMRQLYMAAGLGGNFEYRLMRTVEFTLHGRKMNVTAFVARAELS